MNTSDGYARQPVASSSNVRLARTATVFVMGVLGISYMFNAMDRQVFPALLGGIRATCFASFGLSFFSYTAFYATFLRERLGYSLVAADSTLGMYGLRAMCAVVGGWAGDRLGRPEIFVGPAILMAASFCLFNGATHAAGQNALSSVFGLIVRGFLAVRHESFFDLERVRKTSSPIYEVGSAARSRPGYRSGAGVLKKVFSQSKYQS